MFKHFFDIFEQHFTQALYQSTLHKHFIKALSQGITIAFIKVLRSRLSRYYNRVYQGITIVFIKVLQSRLSRYYNRVYQGITIAFIKVFLTHFRSTYIKHLCTNFVVGVRYYEV